MKGLAISHGQQQFYMNCSLRGIKNIQSPQQARDFWCSTSHIQGNLLLTWHMNKYDMKWIALQTHHAGNKTG